VELLGTGNTVGGTTGTIVPFASPAPGFGGNVISGNGNNGLLLDPGATGNAIWGNFVGTDVTGTQALPNLDAVAEVG
jgi:titin